MQRRTALADPGFRLRFYRGLPLFAAPPMELPAASPRLHRINALLEEALALPPAQRETWLDALAGEDRALVPVLAGLLERSAVETDTFLRAPLRVSPQDLAFVEPEPDRPGDRVGPWRLLRELGQGGMATVWLAERADGGLQRQVALKLPRSGWALGLAQRMARERDILAALEHPRIARLYDAGLTPDGRPWLAMECVAGRPIDQHCRERALGVPQILRLVLQVAEAVAHAHARLVVHRDLKPSNILVTDDGEARLLDFGVAKLLEDEAARPGSPALTEMLGRAVTPDYAAPEQVANRPVTVATDVYSLGIVLYELLTGMRPYRVARSSFGALEEAILHAEVLPASTAVRGRRALVRQLRGDIDVILAKAMAKSPAHRYSSVEALADDLRRHLAGEPVLAQRPSRRYRARKFLRRHRVPLAAATLATASLLSGLGAALWQAHEARLQNAYAQQGYADGEAALEMAGKLLTEGANPGEHLTADELQERRVQLVESIPLSRPRDRAIAADVLISWAINLGRTRDADTLYQRLLGALPLAQVPAELRCKRGTVLADSGRVDEGVQMLERALAEDPSDHHTATGCLVRRSRIARNLNDAAGSLHFASEAVRHLQASGDPSATRRASVLGEMGYALSLGGRTAEAERQYRLATEVLDHSGRGDTGLALSIHNNWGIARLYAGDVLGALSRFEHARTLARGDDGAGPVPQYLQFNLANALGLLTRHDEATVMLEALREEARRRGAPSTELGALNGLALLSLQRGHMAEARQRLDAGAVLLAARQMPPTDPPALTHQRLLAEQALLAGRTGEALERVDSVLESLAQNGVRIGRVSNALVLRSRVQAAAGRPEAALSDAERALDIARQVQGELRFSNFTGDAWLNLARLHRAAGRSEPQRAAAREAAAHLASTLGDEHPDTLAARALAR